MTITLEPSHACRAETAQYAIPQKACELIDALNVGRIRYCHWKSNAALFIGLSGGTDIDLLVHREDASRFRAVLAQCGFKPATAALVDAPSTEHYFGLDPATGVLLHVHAYFRIITGESLAKNYHLPLEDLLLEQCDEEWGVRVPTRGAEALVFMLRLMLKHTRVVELLLVRREWSALQTEARELLGDGGLHQARALAREALPAIDPALLEQCGLALLGGSPLALRVRLGLRLRRSLRTYARRPAVGAWWSEHRPVLTMLLRKVKRTPDGMTLRSGGALIAFVGAEASGKSTLIAASARWLRQHFLVHQVHSGKPPSTPLTLLPNLLVPLLRRLAPARRSCAVTGRAEQDRAGESEASVPLRPFPLIFGCRCVLLAYDRRALLRRAAARAVNGALVLCDRYPFAADGSPDGPQLTRWPLAAPRSLRRWLADTEARLYREIPAADLVIRLRVPLDVALRRNAARGKYEPEEFVRSRHAQIERSVLTHPSLHVVDTDADLAASVNQVQRVIWRSL